jgi:bifunctional DNA-binding transcriptional regulator/antitoxin component of YhaV-PrlF toxin-antitoxin module
MAIEFKGRIDFVEESALMWNYRILVPKHIAEQIKDSGRRIICSINASKEVHCALMSDGNGEHYIVTNSDFRKKHGLENQDEVLVKLRPDDSKYGMWVPVFFEELCIQDPEGSTNFHQLTPGKQRSLLHTIGKLKSETKQMEKTVIIFEYLKSTNGRLDFKELNQAFKSSRFKK